MCGATCFSGGRTGDTRRAAGAVGVEVGACAGVVDAETAEAKAADAKAADAKAAGAKATSSRPAGLAVEAVAPPGMAGSASGWIGNGQWGHASSTSPKTSPRMPRTLRKSRPLPENVSAFWNRRTSSETGVAGPP